MSEDADESSKTEEPTQKKLDEAHKKGNWPLSQEIGPLLSIGTAAVVLSAYIPGMAQSLLRRLEAYIAKIPELSLDQHGVGIVLHQALNDVVHALWLPLLAFVFAGVSATILQKGWSISWEPLMPNFGKLNPLAGFKRIFSGVSQLIELAKGIGKIAVVGAVAWLALKPMVDSIQLFVGIDIALLLKELDELALSLMWGVLAITALIAAADTFWKRHEYNQKMRMTKQEVKDEGKQAEGDPHVKARIRQIRFERARQRMMSNVPGADVVVTNPTHYAVALKYEQGKMGAPVVVAKGVDTIAFKIREIAEENGVPIVENPPLARALYASVDLDEEVPADHYRAVAEVITYVYKLRQQGGGRR